MKPFSSENQSAFDFDQFLVEQNHEQKIAQNREQKLPLLNNQPYRGESLEQQDNSASQQESKKGINKSKGVSKKTKKNKPQVRSGAERFGLSNRVMGRPNNDTVQKEHLKESRLMNDVIYHYVHLLALLKIKQGNQQQLDFLNASESQEEQMSRTDRIMNEQTFPDFGNPHPSFLLHSNSLHFVFHYYYQQHRRSYSSRQLQAMFMAFLRKRQLLTPITYNYLLDYWQDIICLATNPEEEAGEEPHQGHQSQNEKKKLKEDQEVDESIAAYQIACYIHACSKKYKFSITTSR